MTNEKPIIFSARMVLAILEGCKTVTRRVIRPQPGYGHDDFDDGVWNREDEYGDWHDILSWFPYGYVGERLWVRENWRTGTSLDKLSPLGIERAESEARGRPGEYRCPVGCRSCPVFYEADGYHSHWCDDDKKMFGEWGRLRPSIHMPRWASRITLEITGRSYEQLQDITEEGAVAEGFEATGTQTARESFAQLWDEISSDGEKWADNPWVWVVKFKRLEVMR